MRFAILFFGVSRRNVWIRLVFNVKKLSIYLCMFLGKSTIYACACMSQAPILATRALRPLPQEAHERHTRKESYRGARRQRGAGVDELAASKDPVPRPHFDEADPEQDAGRQCVERADGDEGGGVLAVEVLEDADADGHADGRRDAEDGRHEQLLPQADGLRRRGHLQGRGAVAAAVGAARRLGLDRREMRYVCYRRRRVLSKRCDARSQRDTLEHLVEEYHDKKSDEEGVAGNDKSETDYCVSVSMLYSLTWHKPETDDCKLTYRMKDDARLEDQDANHIVIEFRTDCRLVAPG